MAIPGVPGYLLQATYLEAGIEYDERFYQVIG
jgi:hypothetical protein